MSDNYILNDGKLLSSFPNLTDSVKGMGSFKIEGWDSSTSAIRSLGVNFNLPSFDKLIKAFREIEEKFLSDSYFSSLVSYKDPYVTGYSSESRNLSSENILKDFVDRNISFFKNLLFSKESFDSIIEWFRLRYNENKDGSMQLLQNSLSELWEDPVLKEKAFIRILSILQDFEYEEMNPVGILIITSAISLNNEKVQLKVLDVLAHWPNERTYNILKKLAPPSTFLARLKYDSIMNSFNKRYAIFEKD